MVVGSVASAPVGRLGAASPRLPLPTVKLVSESSVLKVEERSVVEQGAEGHFGGEASRYPFSRWRLGLAALILKGVSKPFQYSNVMNKVMSFELTESEIFTFYLISQFNIWWDNR
ncbi:hypothetical protein OsJ_01478 [Oryza sativa Japonica Group]|uniref:Uncharacterized protein n=1 Tax=Oryza sativa subsp. japonica TaxID=39947 RepID=A2ZSB7_ORYSJ|nr:hypothetical protein OsJ_01478 [Oryza sativa Japonica Group]